MKMILFINLCISILEFKSIPHTTYIEETENLCISILEFKYRKIYL